MLFSSDQSEPVNQACMAHIEVLEFNGEKVRCLDPKSSDWQMASPPISKSATCTVMSTSKS
jgi:hypothetical protein